MWKCVESAKKCEKVPRQFLPFGCCPLVFLWKYQRAGESKLALLILGPRHPPATSCLFLQCAPRKPHVSVGKRMQHPKGWSSKWLFSVVPVLGCLFSSIQTGIKRMSFKMASFLNFAKLSFCYPFVLVPVWVPQISESCQWWVALAAVGIDVSGARWSCVARMKCCII